MRRLSLSLFLFLSLFLLTGLACNTLARFNPTPTPGATAVPVTPSPRPTDAPTATLSPSPTPAPSPTPTPALTPYSNGNAGFSFGYPPGWEIAQEDTTGVVLVDQDTGMVLIASSYVGEAEQTFDKDLEDFSSSLALYYTDVEIESQGEVALAEEKVPFADLTTKDQAGDPVRFRVVVPRRGLRAYLFAAFAAPEAFDQASDDLAQLYATIRLFDPQVYGLERRETLVQLGGDPDPEDLDPARAQGSADDYVGHLFSGLVRLSPQLQIQPDLAESWTISPDGKTYTFTLRSGLKFQSGQPITAADVQYSWERAADPATESVTAATYLGDIVGVKDKLEGKADRIAGVEVVDARTLAVMLDAPKPYFLAKLTYPTAYVVNRANVEGGGERWMFEADASGPFAVREYIEDEMIAFDRNENYYAPAKIPHLAYIFNPRGSSISLYEAGDIDLLLVGGENAVRVRRPDDPLNAEWVSTTSMCTSLLQIDVSQPPMDDPDVRRAFALAVDRDALNERFSENLDLPAVSVLPPAMPGYSTDGLPVFAHDPDAARAALAESKYAGNLPPIILNASGYSEPGDFINALAEMWRTTLDAEVRVELLDPRNYTKAAHDNHGHIVSYGWCADYPDPENFLDILFHSDSGFNVAGYDNPEVDQLLEQARTEPDPARRLALYHQAETLILADNASLPLMHWVSDALVKPYVKGYTLAPMGAPYVHLLSLENP
jgi:ABC-type transport system substrate-binding protein